MPLRLKEEPKEWRKSALLTVLGLALMSSLLRWRRVLSTGTWKAGLLVLALLAVLAVARPRWFRGFYRVSMRLGYWSSQVVARVALALIFALLIAPAGLILRMLGKDPLRLKPAPKSDTYWQPAKEPTPLDRLF